MIKSVFFFHGDVQIIVLEDTKEYISYAPKEEIVAQERRPFDLMVKIRELVLVSCYNLR